MKSLSRNRSSFVDWTFNYQRKVLHISYIFSRSKQGDWKLNGSNKKWVARSLTIKKGHPTDGLGRSSSITKDLWIWHGWVLLKPRLLLYSSETPEKTLWKKEKTCQNLILDACPILPIREACGDQRATQSAPALGIHGIQSPAALGRFEALGEQNRTVLRGWPLFRNKGRVGTVS